MIAPEILDIPRIFGIAELEMVEIAGIFGMMELEMLEFMPLKILCESAVPEPSSPSAQENATCAPSASICNNLEVVRLEAAPKSANEVLSGNGVRNGARNGARNVRQLRKCDPSPLIEPAGIHE